MVTSLVARSVLYDFLRFEDIIESEAAQKAEQNLVLNGQKLSVQFAFGDRKSKTQNKNILIYIIIF